MTTLIQFLSKKINQSKTALDLNSLSPIAFGQVVHKKLIINTRQYNSDDPRLNAA